MPKARRSSDQRRRRLLPRQLPALLTLALIVCVILAANVLSAWLLEILNFELRPSNEDTVHRLIMIFAAAYAGLLAVPFVPGIEIGLALIALLGTAIVPLVYLCTVAGLTLSFCIGRMIPISALCRVLQQLGLHRTRELLQAVEPLDAPDRLAFLVSRAPNRFVPFLLHHRYLALAVALNIPGNFLIGGGGGIALIAGLSRLYSFPLTVTTIALAVSPLPLLILFFGIEPFR